MLYKQLIQTDSVLLLLPLSSVLGFFLFEDTYNGRATKHQLYSFAIEVWCGCVHVYMCVHVYRCVKVYRYVHVYMCVQVYR